MNISHYFALVSVCLVFVLGKETNEEQLRKKACESHSCHELTQCHAIRKKDQASDGWTFEPICMKVPSCATKKCENGEKCYLKAVRCRLLPCFQVPTCIPDINDAIAEYQMPPALLV